MINNVIYREQLHNPVRPVGKGSTRRGRRGCKYKDVSELADGEFLPRSTEVKTFDDGTGTNSGWDFHTISKVSSKWTKSFKNDLKEFHSTCLSAEVFLSKVLVATRGLGVPNPLRTAACCVLLHQISSSHSSNQPVLRMIYEELLPSIYSSITSESWQVLSDLTEGKPGQTLDWNLSHTMWSDRYKAMRESFIKYHAVAEQGAKVLAKQQIVLGRTISTWQHMLMRRYISAWYHTVRRLRIRKNASYNHHKRVQRRRMLRQSMAEWRLFTAVQIEKKNIREVRTREESLRTKVALLQDNLLEAKAEINSLDSDKVSLEEEVIRLKEQVEVRDSEIAAQRDEIAQLHKSVFSWKQVTSEICSFCWPTFGEKNPDEFLFSEAEIPEGYEALSEQRKFKVSTNIAFLNRLSSQHKATETLKIPAVKLLQLWMGKLIWSIDKTADLPTNLGTELKDTIVFLNLAKSLMEIQPEFSKKIRAEISTSKRAELIIEKYHSWLRCKTSISTLDITESSVDSNTCFITHIFERTLQSPKMLVTTEDSEPVDGSDLSTEILRMTDPSILLKKYKSMRNNLKRWRSLQVPLQHFASSIIAEHFQNRESFALLNEARKKERDALTNIDSARLADLPEFTIASPTEKQQVQSDVRMVLSKYCEILHRIWKFYVPEGRLMCQDRFWRFITDTKMIGKNCRKSQVTAIYKRANDISEIIAVQTNQRKSVFFEERASIFHSEGLETDINGSDLLNLSSYVSSPTDPESDDEFGEIIENYNPADKLTTTEWIDCLIHLADTKYPNLATDEKLEELMKSHLVKYGCQSVVDEFRDHLYQSDVQAVLTRFNLSLQKIFKWYSKGEHKAKVFIGTDDDMSVSEYKTFLKDAKLLDQTLSMDAACELFKFLQEDGEENPDPISAANTTLVYREFLEVVVCIAIYKLPAPFIKLADRLQTFISTRLLPALKQNNPKLKIGKTRR